VTSTPDAVAAVRQLLQADPRVRVAWLFGSAARGTAGARSDIDVAILVAAPLAAGEEMVLREALAAAARRRVDLVFAEEAPPLLAREIVADGVLLACRDDEARVAFEGRALARYLDTRHLREVQHAYLRERVRSRP
jgi:predicted nucleotidyltransferase